MPFSPLHAYNDYVRAVGGSSRAKVYQYPQQLRTNPRFKCGLVRRAGSSPSRKSTSTLHRRIKRRRQGEEELGKHTQGAQLFGKAVAAFCTLSLIAAVAACSGADSEGDDSNPTISFMLDWTPNTNHVGIYAAQSLGYYKDAGVSVNILPTAQAGAETSVENGVADVGFTTLSNVAAFDAQGGSLRYVFDLTQKSVARWCSLASRTDIKTPKDFDGKTFVSFGSAEQTAVIRQMIKSAGGTGEFQTATAGTNTFQTLSSGKGDFGGFYVTWENVES
jgi:ABC-type nitrate/sulfonate/bicarbonate transport system substrate-binding protein